MPLGEAKGKAANVSYGCCDIDEKRTSLFPGSPDGSKTTIVPWRVNAPRDLSIVAGRSGMFTMSYSEMFQLMPLGLRQRGLLYELARVFGSPKSGWCRASTPVGG